MKMLRWKQDGILMKCPVKEGLIVQQSSLFFKCESI
jgi:hypothetical protein